MSAEVKLLSSHKGLERISTAVVGRVIRCVVRSKRHKPLNTVEIELWYITVSHPSPRAEVRLAQVALHHPLLETLCHTINWLDTLWRCATLPNCVCKM